MLKMWKKTEIDKWTCKAYKCIYKSDDSISLPNTHVTQTKYTNAGKI